MGTRAELAGLIIDQTHELIHRATVILGGPLTDEFKGGGQIANAAGMTTHVPTLEGDDRTELCGTGTLIKTGKEYFVLTAGHVVSSIQRQQHERKLEGGPFVRISAGQQAPKERIRTWEATLVLQNPFCATWGEKAADPAENAEVDPDLGVIWIPPEHVQNIQKTWNNRFELLDGRRKRIERLEQDAPELARATVGLWGERTRQGAENQRCLLMMAWWPEQAERFEDAAKRNTWYYNMENQADRELVELQGTRSGWKKQKAIQTQTYGGMSGSGVWSIYPRWKDPEPNMSIELQGVVFAERPAPPASPTEILTTGPEAVEEFLTEQVIPSITRRRYEEPSRRGP